MTKNVKVELGYWKEPIPSYTIFKKENQIFSSIWTTYTTNFTDFYVACVQDMATYSTSKTLFSKKTFSYEFIEYIDPCVDRIHFI